MQNKGLTCSLSIFIKMLSIFIILLLSQPSFEVISKEEFNGTLTDTILMEWGFSEQETKLDLSRRNIKSIAENTFSQFTSVKELSLSYNQIEEIQADILIDFKNFTYVKLV